MIVFDDDIAEYTRRIMDGGVMAGSNEEKGQVEDMPQM